MQYKQTLSSPDEKSSGTNTCEIFVFHHTGTQEGTINGVLNGLHVRPDEASCHLVVDENGNKYKIGEDTDILWHTGVSSWKGFKPVGKTMNKYAIGCEIIGPLKNGGFTDKQFDSVVELARFYIKKYSIKYENVVRHKDIAPGRKTDVADTFWNTKFKTWDDFKKFLFTFAPMETPSKYTAVYEQTMKETGFTPLFSEHAGDKPLTEKEVKELIDIAFARYDQRIKPFLKK